jgi:hypothetical protein
MATLDEIMAGTDFTGSYQDGGRTGYFKRPLYQNVSIQTHGPTYAKLDFTNLSPKSKAKRIEGLAKKVGSKLGGFWSSVTPELSVAGDVMTFKYNIKDTTWQEGLLYWPYERTMELKVNKTDGTVTMNYAAAKAPTYVAGQDISRIYSALKGKKYMFVKPAAPAVAPAPGPGPGPAPAPPVV